MTATLGSHDDDAGAVIVIARLQAVAIHGGQGTGRDCRASLAMTAALACNDDYASAVIVIVIARLQAVAIHGG